MLLSEEELVARSQQGDLVAFEALMGRYEKKVYSIAYRLMGNHEDALDLAQEAFIKVYRSIGGFRKESSFMHWLYRVVVNCARDELRKKKRTPVVPLEGMEPGTPSHSRAVEDWSQSPERLYEIKETQETIHRALLALDPDHRMVLVLRDLLGFPYEEMAEILSCSLGTVKSRISRSRAALRRRLAAGDFAVACCDGERRGRE